MPMLELEELKLRLTALEPQLRELRQALDIDRLEVESQELDQRTAEPGFWDNAEASQKILQRGGRAEGQHDLLRRPPYPPAHRYCGGLPGGAQPVPEPGGCHEYAALQAHRDQGAGAPG